MRYLLLLELLFFALFLQAKEVPYLSGRVVDEVGVLDQETVNYLNQLLKTHEDSTSNQIAVLIIQSLEGEILEEYSLKVAETWGLGQKDRDNGVLLLISLDDRKLRIEVGYGLEGVLTDALSSNIIRNEITPAFRVDDYSEGVRAGTESIIKSIRGEYSADISTSDLSNINNDIPWFIRLFMGFIFLIVVGTFTYVALFSKGCSGWGLYLFLIPFYLTFPMFILGITAGIVLFLIYFFGFLFLKIIYFKTPAGKKFYDHRSSSIKTSNFSSGSGWSSGGSSFSGGGGSFGGGGSSGSW
ncbi:TPM domain-containing protein [Fulvivirga sp. 29W222]|uniref:TPM domain-containing protein n=1 Tax=Fulvivirga marina TaxID=2494733 RepID=A0A937KGS2_9BACT|nr:TPM domain-containing protein [Fulvivirga marina]MBL6449735.1 TPM domain-containing protein [Fulvivirga marina]